MWKPDPSTFITAEQKILEINAIARQQQFPNLEPDEFWFVVRASGYEPALLSWVATMNQTQITQDMEIDGEISPTLVDNPSYDPVAWAEASAKLQYAKWFERDHPFIEAARIAIGMSIQELDSLWIFGTNS